MHEAHDDSWLPEPARLFAALRHGAPDLPSVVAPGEVAIAAAGVWGRYGSVVVLRRDQERDQECEPERDQDDGALLDDVYLLACSPDGRWLPPDRCSGSGMPEWVLARPDGPLPDWRGSDLVNLGSQLAHVDGCWVAELTVMADRAIATVEVRYGGDRIRVSVPAGGLVTLPGAVRSVDDVAEFRGFDEAGVLRAVLHHRPLTEYDRSIGWPDESLWAAASA